MEAVYNAPDLERWRRATILATTVAVLELALLVTVGVVVLAKPIAHALRKHAAAAALPAAHRSAAPAAKPVKHVTAPAPKAKLTRTQTRVLVLNGNGRSGVAHVEATKLQSLGYHIAGASNAKRQDYATTVVMYAPGYQGEGARLAHDLGAKVVGPLDGLTKTAMHGGELAVILGAS